MVDELRVEIQESAHAWSVVVRGEVDISSAPQLEAVLEGKKLVPFWRGEKKQGVNVKRVFTEPTQFDLVLWVQGGAAIPYLEEGPMTDPGFWRDLQRGFRGQLFWFAIWVN